MRIQIDIAPAELIDRITILEIKLASITDQEKISHVINDLNTLNKSAKAMREAVINNGQSDKLTILDQYTAEIKNANQEIWDVLQEQRDLEHSGDLGEKFVEASLKVYYVNDKRAHYKRLVNDLLGTDIAEVKFYTHQ